MRVSIRKVKPVWTLSLLPPRAAGAIDSGVG